MPFWTDLGDLDVLLLCRLNEGVTEDGPMNSEAAYFPDASPGTAEGRGAEQRVPEIPAEILDRVQFSIAPPEERNGTHLRATEASDENLVEQLRKGSGEALGLLFRRYARAVRNVAFRILRDEGEADDLVQEVFLFVFRKASLYTAARGKAATWIIHVAYHRAFDRRRYLNTRHFYSKQELNDTGSTHLGDSRKEIPFHDRSIEATLGRDLAGKLASNLTAEQREIIQLFFFEGYTLREIAGRTGRSLVNVRSYYYRGLERLRKLVLSEQLSK
jgi:RNA polymerase sigma-70 factor, ECF subfamily